MKSAPAAVLAPSAPNVQPWSFAVQCGRLRRLAFSDLITEHGRATLLPMFELHEHPDPWAIRGRTCFTGRRHGV